MSHTKNGKGSFLPYDLFHIILHHLEYPCDLCTCVFIAHHASSIRRGKYHSSADTYVLQGSKLYTELIRLPPKLSPERAVDAESTAAYRHKLSEGAGKD